MIPRRLSTHLKANLLLAAFAVSYFAFAQQAPARRPSAALRITQFYAIPNPLPAGDPGQLIRSQPADEYDLPENVSAVRILYHSRSGGGQDVAVSGVVLVPDAKPPATGWPILAWAHPTCAVLRDCAPSLLRNLLNGPFLTMYAKLGYAVVATDYAGISGARATAVADPRSSANDVIYAVAAARKATPQLGARWFALGESTGALTALVVAASEPGTQGTGYLGSVAVNIPASPPSLPVSPAAKAASPRALFILTSEDVSRSAEQLVHALCADGARIEFDRYPVDPATLLASTVRDQMAWIQDRLAGRPAPSNCPQ